MEDIETLDVQKNENKTISSIEDYGSNNTNNEKNVVLVYDTDSNFNSFYDSQNTFNTKDSKYYDKINEMVSKENQLNEKESSIKKNNDFSFDHENNESYVNDKNNFDINNIRKEENKEKIQNKNIFGYYENLNNDSNSNVNLNNNNNSSNNDCNQNITPNYLVGNEKSKMNQKNDKNIISNENPSNDRSDPTNLHKCYICGSKNIYNPYLFEKCDHALCQDCFSIICLVDLQYLNQLFQIHENKVYKFFCKCGKGHLDLSSEKLVQFLSEIDNSKSLEEKVKSEQMICVDCKNPAEVYCQECECFSCDECFKIAHPAKIKRLADHPKSKDFLNLDLKERKIKCSRDGGEYTLYCNSCNYLLCNVCKISHSNHNIEPIPKIFKNYDEKFNLMKGDSMNIHNNNLNNNNTLKNSIKSDFNNSLVNPNDKFGKSLSNPNNSFSHNDLFNVEEKQTKNLLEYKKNVLNSCDQIIKMVKKLATDFEMAIDYEIKEKTNMNLIRRLISEKAENVTKNTNSIYFLKYLNYFSKNNTLKNIKSDLQYTVDLSILKTLENIKGNIPYIYPSNCLLKYSYLNKINVASNDATFDKVINGNIKNESINSQKNKEELNKNNENITLNKNISMKSIQSNSLGKLNLNLNNNYNSVQLNSSLNGEKIINVNNHISNNNIDNMIIQNPTQLKKSDSIKIENLHKNNIKRLYLENNTNTGVTHKSLNEDFLSENEKKIKSVLITNYFDKMLLIYSIGNKFFLNDLEKQQLYYQSELSDDIINNIFFKTIQGIPILIILGKKNCVFWDILTKQTVWKFTTDHFNFDSLLLIDLEIEILGKNPNSPLNDETKIIVESYFNNLDFSTYLQNLSVILWQSEYSGYHPFEYFYSDDVFKSKKRKLFGIFNNNNTNNRSFSNSQQQFGYIDKWVNKNGVMHIICGNNGKIYFCKYNNEISENSINKFEELITNRNKYILENLIISFYIPIEGFYSGMLNYNINNKNIFYIITYGGNLDKVCLSDKIQIIVNPEIKIEKIKSNKYNGLFKIYEWCLDYCYLFGEKVIYLYSMKEDIVVKTIKTNSEISKLLRFNHLIYGDCLAIIFVTGDVDILHI